MTPRTLLALVLFAGSSWGGTPAESTAPVSVLEEPALVVRHPRWTGAFTTTADGLLRVTVTATGVVPPPLPFSVDPPRGTRPVVAAPGGGFAAGALTLLPDDAGAVWMSIGDQRLARLEVERAEAGTLSVRLEVERSTAFHGLGQSSPKVALRSGTFQLTHVPRFGDQTYLYIPFLLSDAGLALYANTASDDVFVLEKGRTVAVRTATGRVDLFLLGPGTPAALVSRFYELSQSRSLLPRWAYGYIQSKYGYRTDAELRAVVSTFKRADLPLSAVVLDLFWYRRMGDLEWNREAFPDPRGLDAWLEQQGVKLITISEPFIARDSTSFGALQDAGGLAVGADGGVVLFSDWWDFGKAQGGIFDPTSEGAKRVLARRYEAMVEDGVDGFWLDLGEPERVPPQARFGPWTEAAFHDFYNLEWARLVRGAALRAHPGQRPFMLSRSGFTGIAGLGVATWSGDVPASWEGLKAQVPLGLNASLSGLPYWGCDVGGFVGRGELIPPDPELYWRWQQLGALLPVDRAHGAGPREPWIYGPEWLERIRRALVLRAQLLPYLYSTAAQVMSQGLPMMRPLYFLEPGQPRWHEEETEFLLGDFLLAAPVLHSMKTHPTHQVRLPAGTWYDLATLKPASGDLHLPVTLDTYPVYVREGAIVPLAPRAGEEAVLLLPGASPSTFTVFSDDGVSEAYRSGAGEKLVVTLDATGVSFSGATRARPLTLLFAAEQRLPTLGTRAQPRAPYKAVTVQLRAGTTRVAW